MVQPPKSISLSFWIIIPTKQVFCTVKATKKKHETSDGFSRKSIHYIASISPVYPNISPYFSLYPHVILCWNFNWALVPNWNPEPVPWCSCFKWRSSPKIPGNPWAYLHQFRLLVLRIHPVHPEWIKFADLENSGHVGILGIVKKPFLSIISSAYKFGVLWGKIAGLVCYSIYYSTSGKRTCIIAMIDHLKYLKPRIKTIDNH